MANWQYKINLTASRRQYEKDGNVQALCDAHAVKIKELIKEVRADHRLIVREMADELENDVLPMFEAQAENEDADIDDYDYALESLYDWADTSLDRNFNGMRMCWVETMML